MFKKFWKINKSRIHINFILTMILCIAGLMVTFFMVRTMKLNELDEKLIREGNYDFSFYNITDKLERDLEKNKLVGSIGIIYEFGEFNIGNRKILVGGLKDEITQQLFYIPELKGHYPKKENEICMDRITLKECGYKGDLGEKIDVQMNGTHKSYQLSGIIELKKANDDGTTQCFRKAATESASLYRKGTDTGITEDFPMAYVYAGDAAEKYTVGKKHCFVALKDLNDKNRGQFRKKYYSNPQWENDFCFTNVASELFVRTSIKLDLIDYMLWGGQNISEGNVAAVMKNDTSQKDIYTKYMIPIIGILIAMISFISMYDVIRIGIERKKEQYGTLLCLGIKQSDLMKYIIFTYFVYSVFSVICGYLFGCISYNISLKILADFFDVNLPSALQVNTIYAYYLPYVKEVTLDPWFYPFAIITVSEIFALCLGLFPMLRMTPLETLKSKIYKRKNRRGTRLHEIINRNLGREPFFDRLVPWFCIGIVMTLSVFGYLFFRCKAAHDHSELQRHIESAGVGNFDYYMDRTEETIDRNHYYCEGRHDTGVSRDDMDKIETSESVSEAYGIIVNRSSALIYPKGDIKAAFLNTQNENIHETEDSKQWHKKLGLKESEELFNVPTVGVRKKDIELINRWAEDEENFLTMEGTLDYEKLASGEEVVVLIKNEHQKKAFELGEKLPMCDFCLPDKMDADSSVLQGTYENYKNNYYHLVRFSPKVGAVIYLNEYEDNFYFEDYNNATVNVLTLTDSFSAWKLPDRNYTRVGVLIKKDSNPDEFQPEWYSVLTKAQFMGNFDVNELIYLKENGQKNVMSIFYVLVIHFFVIGIFAIQNVIGIRLQKTSKEISYMQVLGMKQTSMIWIHIIKYVRIIFSGAVISYFTVISFSSFCKWCSRMRNAALDNDTMETLQAEKPWVYLIPNYKYAEQPVLGTVFIVSLLTLFIVSISVAMYIRKNKENK